MLPKCDLLLKLEQLILDVLSVFSKWAFSPFDNSFWIKVWRVLLYYFVLLYAVVRAHPCNHNSSFDGIFFLHFIIPSHSGTVHLDLRNLIGFCSHENYVLMSKLMLSFFVDLKFFMFIHLRVHSVYSLLDQLNDDHMLSI